MPDWTTYYYQAFPGELREYLHGHVPKHHCEHCQAPRHRRCLLEPGIRRRKSAMFRFAWYGLTLFDQGLYRYFPEASQRWVSATGGYPLPVEPIGFGCVRVAAPSRLLAVSDNLSDWNDYVSFWLQETEDRFETMTGLSPQRFFSEVVQDRDFDRQNYGVPFESVLLRQAFARFGE